jgi:hypothetical protein
MRTNVRTKKPVEAYLAEHPGAKQYPILMNRVSMEGLLEGRKTQTRRVVKPQAAVESTGTIGPWVHLHSRGCPGYHGSPGSCDSACPMLACPYGKPGDLLWVRERWAAHHCWDHMSPTELLDHRGFLPDQIWFEVKGSTAQMRGRLRASIHMPKAMSRVWLVVTKIAVERLQDITPAALAWEGCPQEVGGPHGDIQMMWLWFKEGWDKLNASRGFPWSSNPWVWVITFRRLT